MKRQRAKFDPQSRCCVSLCNSVNNASSVDLFCRYANCRLSMNGKVQALIFGRITFSKHLEHYGGKRDRSEIVVYFREWLLTYGSKDLGLQSKTYIFAILTFRTVKP